MQDSPEQDKNGAPGEQKADLGLGRRVYARHLGFPSASPVGAGIAKRLAWFGADGRLPLARHILQRWSAGAGGGQGLPSLQWLSDFTSSRKKTAAGVVPREVTNISRTSEVGVDAAAGGEAQPASPVNGASPASSAASLRSSGSYASSSLPARVTTHSRVERAGVPILRSSDEGTVSKNATAPAQFAWTGEHALPVKAVNTAARRIAQGPASAAGDSATNAAIEHPAGAASTSGVTKQSSGGNTRTPVFRSAEKKSGNASRVRSTIVESARHGSRTSASAAGAGPPGPGDSASTSMRVDRDTHLPAETVSGAAGTGAELAREVEKKHPLEAEPDEHKSDRSGELDAVHSSGAEGQGSILRAVGPNSEARTFVGPPIFRRILKQGASTVPPTNVFRSPQGSHDSGAPVPSPRVVPTSSGKEESIVPQGEERQSATRAAMTDSGAAGGVAINRAGTETDLAGSKAEPQGLKPASVGASGGTAEAVSFPKHDAASFPKPIHETTLSKADAVPHTEPLYAANSGNPDAAPYAKPVYKTISNNNNVGASAISKATETGAVGHGEKKTALSRGNALQARTDAGPAHSSWLSDAGPAQARIERSTGSASAKMDGEAFLQRTDVPRVDPQGRTSRRDADADAASPDPSFIHAQASLGAAKSQTSADGNKASQAPLHSSPSGSAAVEPAIARAADTAASSLPEGKVVSTSARLASSQNQEGAVTPVFRDAVSRGERTGLQGLKLTSIAPLDGAAQAALRPKPIHESGTGGPAYAAYENSAGGRVDETRTGHPAVGAAHPDEPRGESESVTHLIPRTSAPASSVSFATERGLNNSVSVSATEAMQEAAGTVAPAPAQLEKVTIPAGSSGANFAMPVWRSSTTEPGTDPETIAREFEADGGHAIHRSTINVGLSPAEGRAAANQGPAALRRPAASILRQSALPAGLLRLSTVGVVPGVHRFAGLPAAESVYRSSVRAFDAAGPFQSSTLTHRTVSAIERLQRAADPGVAGISSQMNARHAYPVVARAAGSAPGIPAPSSPTSPTLPTVANQSSGSIQGMKKAEITQLANRVYDMLVRRIADERQRRGH